MNPTRHRKSEVLGVHLATGQHECRAGSLVRNADGMIRLHAEESFLDLPHRPILSSSLLVPGDEAATQARLRDSSLLKGGRMLPPWFENLLPEGALRSFVEDGVPAAGRNDFDLLRHVGLDLPGAVIIREEDCVDTAYADAASARQIRFSIAGVQMKLSMTREGDGFALADSGIGGDTIVKLPNDRLPWLPEVEYSAMQLAGSVGVDVANCELVPVESLRGIPDGLQAHKGVALAVERFDRTPDGGRIHMEDFNQTLGVAADRKYAAANDETVLKIAALFGTGETCFLEACRRAAVNILAGNTDAHLKNWSIWYPIPSKGQLSPAYDIVPGAVYDYSDEMALRFRRTRNAAIMDIRRFERAAAFAGFSAADFRSEIGLVVEKAADTWGSLLRDLPMPEEFADLLLKRTQRLALTQDFGCDFIGASRTASR